MADYTEEQRVKQVWPSACISKQRWNKHRDYMIVRFSPMGQIPISGAWNTPDAAWADASRRLGNEFVDEVGPLAERKEG